MKALSNREFDAIPLGLKILPCENLNEVSEATDNLLAELHGDGARRFILPYGETQLQKLYPNWANGQGKFAPAISNTEDPITIYELDELLGLENDDPRRFAAGLERILDQAGHPKELRVLFNSHGDPMEIIREYKKQLILMGRPQVALLGVGPNGHAGYHEPDTPPNKGIHVSILKPSSRRQQIETFSGLDNTPTMGATWGVSDFKKMTPIVMASGESKASPLGLVFNSDISVRDNPVSFLAKMPEGQTAYLIADRTALAQTPIGAFSFA